MRSVAEELYQPSELVALPSIDHSGKLPPVWRKLTFALKFWSTVKVFSAVTFCGVSVVIISAAAQPAAQFEMCVPPEESTQRYLVRLLDATWKMSAVWPE